MLIEKLAEKDGLKGAMIAIDTIATNAAIARAILDAGADYLLAAKANQSTTRAEIERYFDDAPAESMETHVDVDKGHGRVDKRFVTVSGDTDCSMADAGSPARPACPRRVRSSASPHASNSPIGQAPKRDTSSRPERFPPSRPPEPSAAIGP